MFCPNCGKEREINQNFCRFCGNECGEILEGKSDWVKSIGNFSIGAVIGIIICFLLILFADFSHLYFGGLVLLLAIYSTILSGLVSKLFFENRQNNKAKNLKPINKEELFELKPTTLQLQESTLEPILSVTEVTTNFLFLEAKRKTSGELK